MAINPLKILTALSATYGADISGGDLTIAGKRVATAEQISGSFATLSGVSGTFASLAGVSGTFASLAGVSGTFASLAGVSGSFTTPSQVSASIAAITGAAVTFENNVTVKGDLYVQGTTTAVSSSNLIVQDAIVVVGSGSNPVDSTTGLIFGGSNRGALRYKDGTLTVARTDSDGSSNDINVTGTGSLVVGALTFSASKNYVVPSGESSTTLWDSGSNDLETLLSSSFNTFLSSIQQMQQSALQASTVNNAYKRARKVLIATLDANMTAKRATFWLAYPVGSNSEGSDSGDNAFNLTSSTVTGMSSDNQSTFRTGNGGLRGLSLDVAVLPYGSNTWSNDLVSVTVDSKISGSIYYPFITVDAPGLGDLSGAQTHKIRLIVSNESENAFSVS